MIYLLGGMPPYAVRYSFLPGFAELIRRFAGAGLEGAAEAGVIGEAALHAGPPGLRALPDQLLGKDNAPGQDVQADGHDGIIREFMQQHEFADADYGLRLIRGKRPGGVCFSERYTGWLIMLSVAFFFPDSGYSGFGEIR